MWMDWYANGRRVVSILKENLIQFWYWNSIPAVQCILGHPLFTNFPSYLLVEQVVSSGNTCWDVDHRLEGENAGNFPGIKREIVSGLISLCLGKLECERECAREIMSEGSCQRDYVRGIMSERSCQGDHVREIMSESSCQRVCQRASESCCHREHVKECVRDSVSVSAPALTGFCGY